jgi:hypothetical protein
MLRREVYEDYIHESKRKDVQRVAETRCRERRRQNDRKCGMQLRTYFSLNTLQEYYTRDT